MVDGKMSCAYCGKKHDYPGPMFPVRIESKCYACFYKEAKQDAEVAQKTTWPACVISFVAGALLMWMLM